eukprot:303184_1
MIYIFVAILTLWISQTSSTTLKNLGKFVEGTGNKLKCDLKDGCKQSTFNCIADKSCTVTCDVEAACDNLIINGGDAKSIDVTCSETACKEIVVNGAGVGDVSVSCSGKDSCQGGDTSITCGNGKCNLECILSETSCIDIMVDASSASEFECVDGSVGSTGYCQQIGEIIRGGAPAKEEEGLFSDIDNDYAGQREVNIEISFGKRVSTMISVMASLMMILSMVGLVYFYCYKGKERNKVTFDHQSSITQL